MLMKITITELRIKMKQLFTILSAIMLIVFNVVFLTACDYEEQAAMQELHDRIAELEAANDELRDQMNELETSNDELKDQMNEAEEETYNGKEIIMGDFSVILTVDKTEVKVGEDISATMSLKNISGHDITLEIPDWIAYLGKKNKEDILQIIFLPENLESIWMFEAVAVLERPRITIEPDEVIERTVKYEVTEKENLKVSAGAFYYLIDGSGNASTMTCLYSKLLTIKVN